MYMKKPLKLKTKKCMHCKGEIPLKDKVCPNCKKKQTGLFSLIVFYGSVLIVFGAIVGSCTSSDVNKTQTYTSISELDLDELQQLYLNFDSTFSYVEARNYIMRSKLPYSEVKYNGSRAFQIAFTEGCTAQKYKKESGDYLTISYAYPKKDNSKSDDLSKYTFNSCSYVPANRLSLTECESGNYISELGTKLNFDSTITKEEQMLYYYNNKDREN